MHACRMQTKTEFAPDVSRLRDIFPFSAGYHLAPVVQRVDNTYFVNTCPLDCDFSFGLRYSPFEQLGPDVTEK